MDASPADDHSYLFDARTAEAVGGLATGHVVRTRLPVYYSKAMVACVYSLYVDDCSSFFVGVLAMWRRDDPHDRRFCCVSPPFRGLLVLMRYHACIHTVYIEVYGIGVWRTCDGRDGMAWCRCNSTWLVLMRSLVASGMC